MSTTDNNDTSELAQAIQDVSERMSLLVREEIELAKTEVTEKVSKLAKAAAIGCVVAVIDDSFAKLRLFKITEYVSGAFLLAVLGVFTLYLGGG